MHLRCRFSDAAMTAKHALFIVIRVLPVFLLLTLDVLICMRVCVSSLKTEMLLNNTKIQFIHYPRKHMEASLHRSAKNHMKLTNTLLGQNTAVQRGSTCSDGGTL